MAYLEENLHTRIPLRFKDGKFKILAISDLHGICDYDTRLIRDLEALLDGVRPDFLFVLGDMVWEDALESEEKLYSFLSDVFGVVEKRNIPWAHVFGNHDNDVIWADFSQQSVYEKFPHNLTKRGPSDIHGIGNFVLPVRAEKSEDIVFNIWGIDSHDSMNDFMREFSLGDPANKWDKQCVYPSCLHDWGCGYDTLNFDQVMWYFNSSVELEKYAGHKIPGIMGMHIPLPEYVIGYKNTAETYYDGTRREAVGCPVLNSGMFNAVIDRGDIKTLVAGHDHINDYEATYLGIKMTYDAGLNYDGYCADDLRGGRVFEIDEKDAWNIKTYMVRSKDYVGDYPGTCLRKSGKRE